MPSDSIRPARRLEVMLFQVQRTDSALCVERAVDQPSCEAVALPKRRYIGVAYDACAPCSIKHCLFVVIEHIHTGAPRLDFARNFGEFLLVFVVPSRNSIQNVFYGLAHARNYMAPLRRSASEWKGRLTGQQPRQEKLAAIQDLDGGRYRD